MHRLHYNSLFLCSVFYVGCLCSMFCFLCFVFSFLCSLSCVMFSAFCVLFFVFCVLAHYSALFVLMFHISYYLFKCSIFHLGLVFCVLCFPLGTGYKLNSRMFNNPMCLVSLVLVDFFSLIWLPLSFRSYKSIIWFGLVWV